MVRARRLGDQRPSGSDAGATSEGLLGIAGQDAVSGRRASGRPSTRARSVDHNARVTTIEQGADADETSLVARRGTAPSGVVEAIHVTSAAGAPMRAVSRIRA